MKQTKNYKGNKETKVTYPRYITVIDTGANENITRYSPRITAAGVPPPPPPSPFEYTLAYRNVWTSWIDDNNRTLDQSRKTIQSTSKRFWFWSLWDSFCDANKTLWLHLRSERRPSNITKRRSISREQGKLGNRHRNRQQHKSHRRSTGRSLYWNNQSTSWIWYSHTTELEENTC